MSAVQAQMSHGLLSSWSVLKPNKMKDLFAVRGHQGGDYFLTIKALGWQKPVDQESYNHWEEDYIHANFKSAGAVTGHGAGDPVNITLHTDSVDASNRFYPVVGDELLFGNGASRVVGTVSSINVTTPTAPVLTVMPKQVADTIPDLTQGQTLFIFSNSHGEGTGQPDGRISGVTEYTNYLKIIKHDVKATGTSMTDKLWFDIPWAKSDPKAPAGSYYRKSLVDLDFRMGLTIGGALQFDVPTTNTALVDAVEGTRRQGTLGLSPAIGLYGYTETVVPGTFTIGDFNTYGRIFTRENVTESQIMSLLGYDLDVEIEDTMVDFLQGTDVDYTRKGVTRRLFSNRDDMEASVGFAYMTKAKRTYMFKTNYDYSNVNTYGSTGYSYSNMGFMIPMGKSKDAKTNEMVGSIGYRYKKLGDYSREFKVWDTGSANMSKPTDDKDVLRTHSMAHIGAHQIGVNRFIRLEPSL